MAERKTLDELTLMDDYMFAAVMRDERNLRKSFVLFICNYDPFEKSQYIYTFENICKEVDGLQFGDEAFKVVVNTKGTEGEIDDELKQALIYLDEGKVTGDYARQLDDAVRLVKSSEERRHEYMVMMIRDMEMKEEGREEGREEGEYLLSRLMSALFADGRIEDAKRAAADQSLRRELYKQYRLA